MSIQAKERLVEDVAHGIGEFLTVTQTDAVTDVLNEKLYGYEVTERYEGEISKDLLNVFLEAKRIEGRSAKTINRYSYEIERMLMDVGKPIERISVYDIRHYFMEMKNRGMQDSSIEGVRSVMSSFFGWLWKEQLIPANPCANIGTIKVQKKIRLPYSAAEIEKLKSGCTNIRDKAIVCFLLSTGARINEVTMLNRDDVDYKNLEIKVLGKGNKERTVYMDEVTAMILTEYQEQRTDESEALFSGIRKNVTARLTPHGVREMLVKLGDRVGVENVHPHRFRRTLATNLINHGMPIQEVACILGHENLDTTMKYVYLDKANVKNAYRKYA